jgi:hypothetical protein
MKTMKKNAEALLEDGLQVNKEKTECVVVFRHPNGGQSLNILIYNK